jgi:dolichol-phosphate mannosyltransferase
MIGKTRRAIIVRDFQPMNVVVVTATYNERDSIGKFITIVEEEVFPHIIHHRMHLLVADDDSPDGTGDIVRGFMQRYPNLAISSGSKRGLGAAYLRAMSYAIECMNADVLISIDGDLQHDPHTILEFLQKIEQGYDIVCGTRYSHGGSTPKNWPLYRKAFSVVGNFIVQTVTGRFHLHDWTTGFRAIKREVFLQEREKIRPFQGYTFMVAFLYKAILDGYTAGEVPIHFMSRKFGHSKIAPLEYIVDLLKYVVAERLGELQWFKPKGSLVPHVLRK